MTNREIRSWYHKRVETIPEQDARWKRAGIPVEERALRVYEIRRRARLEARSMMADPADIEAVRERDRKKYGNPDGPSFEWLVERSRRRGKSGDTLYEEIIRGAPRTDAQVNSEFGSHKKDG